MAPAPTVSVRPPIMFTDIIMPIARRAEPTISVRPPIMFTDAIMPIARRAEPTASTPEQAQIQSSNSKHPSYGPPIAAAVGVMLLIFVVVFVLKVVRPWYHRCRAAKAKAKKAQDDQQQWLKAMRHSYVPQLQPVPNRSNLDLEKALGSVGSKSFGDLPLRNTAPSKTTELEAPRSFEEVEMTSAKPLKRNGIPLQRFAPQVSSHASSEGRYVQAQGGYRNVDGVFQKDSMDLSRTSKEPVSEAWWAENALDKSHDRDSLKTDITLSAASVEIGEAIPVTVKPVSPTMVELPPSPASRTSLDAGHNEGSPFVVGEDDQEDDAGSGHDGEDPKLQ